jgi:hypothetical protein
MTYNRVQKTTPAAKLKEKPERKERDGERESERGKNPKKKKKKTQKREIGCLEEELASQLRTPKEKTKNNWGQERTTQRERERERERAFYKPFYMNESMLLLLLVSV